MLVILKHGLPIAILVKLRHNIRIQRRISRLDALVNLIHDIIIHLLYPLMTWLDVDALADEGGLVAHVSHLHFVLLLVFYRRETCDVI